MTVCGDGWRCSWNDSLLGAGTRRNGCGPLECKSSRGSWSALRLLFSAARPSTASEQHNRPGHRHHEGVLFPGTYCARQNDYQINLGWEQIMSCDVL